MLISYARVSTQYQDTGAQISALETSGCKLIFQERAFGSRWDKP
ncbi:recombinase family protein [Nitrosomonas sp.]